MAIARVNAPSTSLSEKCLKATIQRDQQQSSGLRALVRPFMQTLAHHDIRASYRSAVGCLRLVEVRRPTGRRFGSDAGARRAGFRGELTTADRLDLLLRDAGAEWPSAFGARRVFGEPAVAEDGDTPATKPRGRKKRAAKDAGSMDPAEGE